MNTRIMMALATAILALGLGGCWMPVRTGADQSSMEKAVAYLQTSSTSPDADIRANCIESLEFLKDTRATGVIEQGLRDPEPEVRFSAVVAAGKRKEVALKATLQQMLRPEKNGAVRVAIVYALRRMGDHPNMDILANGLESPDAKVRANTALVLGLLGDQTAKGLLHARQGEKDARVKFELTAALARLGDPAAQDTLMGMSVMKYEEDRFMAMAACPGVDRPEVANILLRGLSDLAPEGRLIAARAIGQMGWAKAPKVPPGSPDPKSLAQDAVHDSDPRLRALAALALGDLISPPEGGTLIRMMDDSDEHVRVAAAAGTLTMWARAAIPATAPAR